MFQFEHPERLYFLFLLLLVLGLYGLALWRSIKLSKRMGEKELLTQLVPDQSRGKPRFKLILFSLALAALIIAWANPQMGVEQKPAKREAADIYLAMDISRSMLAEDIAPNRLERAKRIARDLVKAIRTERIATILFAGYAYIQTPLTSDFAQVDLLLRSANPELVEFQGTAVGEAINLAVRLAPEGKGKNSALILFSDGESHEAGWEEAVDLAKESGFSIYTIGVGSAQGAPIPQMMGGRKAFIKDKEGTVVQTRMDEATLRQIAERGNGKYYSAEQGVNRIVNQLSEEIGELEKQEFDQPVYGEYRSYFQYFIGLALVFLLLEGILSYRKNRF